VKAKGLRAGVCVWGLLLLLAGCAGVHLSLFQVVKKTAIPLGKDPKTLNVDFPNSYAMRLPTDYAFSQKELLFSDTIDQSVKRYATDGRFIARMIPPFPFSPGRVVQNQRHEVYVQNSLESEFEGSSGSFELLKFDPEGKYVKKLGPFFGCLERISLVGNTNLLLLIREGNSWRIERFIDDLKVLSLRLDDIPACAITNAGTFISAVYPFNEGKLLLVALEIPQETKKGVETLQKHLIIELMSKRLVKEIIRKPNESSTLAAVDQNGNLYYYKYRKKGLLEVIVQNVDYDLMIRKSWKIPFRNRDGLLISSFINDHGLLYQVRANKKRLIVLQYQ
jgi:hypothetical protein